MVTIKKYLLKRSLAFILAVIVCVGVINVTTFAATSTAEPTTPIERIDVPVEDGVYYADIDLFNASNPNQYSMGNAALRGSTSFKQKQTEDTYYKAIVVVKDNQATAIVEFMPMGYIGMYGFMMELEAVDAKYLQQWGGIYDKDAVFTPAEVLARHMTNSGKTVYDPFNNPESDSVFNGNKQRPAGFGYDTERTVDISDQPYSHILALDVTPIHIGFESNDTEIPTDISEYSVDNAAYVHVFVPVMFSISASSGDQYARMNVNWTTLEKIENPENNLQYCLWSAKQIEQGNYTSVSYNELQSTIAEITEALENIWPEQTISMNGTGFSAMPNLEQKEYSDSEKAEMTRKLNAAVSALEQKGEKSTLISLTERADKISANLYTAKSYAEMRDALTLALTVQNNEDAGVSEVERAVQNLNNALEALIYKDADYSAVNAAIKGIPQDLFSICTEETANAVKDMQDAVDWTLNITKQNIVDEYAVKILDAVRKLIYLEADYSKVSAAIAEIPENLSLYTDETSKIVNDAWNSVDWKKNKTEQDVVDEYARTIKEAVSALVFKPADYTSVDEALSKVPEDLSVYTDETADVLNSAVNAVVRGKDMSERELVDNYSKAIESALNELKYKSADYTAVDEVLEKIPSDLSLYTDETVQRLKDLCNAVDTSKNITEQLEVDAYAADIESALNGLTYKEADYSAVDRALANIPQDLSIYTEESVIDIQNALDSVVRGKKITEQSIVDEMALVINTAVERLELKFELPEKNKLEDGVYSIYGEMIKVNRQDKSMSNDAINHTIKLTVSNGKYYITIDFKGLTYLNRFGYLANLSYYDNGYSYGLYGKINGTLIPAEVLSTQKNTDGSDIVDEFNQKGGSSEGILYPDQLKFPLVSDALDDEDGYIPLHVFVPVMEDISEGTGDQDVLLKLDWSTLAKTTEDDPVFWPDDPVELSPAVDVIDSATGIEVHADEGVFDEGVKLVVNPIDYGEDYDKAFAALVEIGKRFKLYEIHFADGDGNEVQPNGTVTVSYPIPAEYNADNVVMYRINEDGSKTLIKGTVENGYYIVVTKSFSSYALVEKDENSSQTINSQNDNNGHENNNQVNENDQESNNNTDNNDQKNNDQVVISNQTENIQNYKSSPKTSDNSNFIIYILLVLVSSGTMIVLSLSKEKQINEGE